MEFADNGFRVHFEPRRSPSILEDDEAAVLTTEE